MYVKWEWNLKECVIFKTFLYSLPHLFFWNINLLPYKKKKKKKKKYFQPMISNTCPHYLTKHNTKKLCLFGFALRNNFFSKDIALVTCVWGVVDVYGVCFQCVMVSMLCLWDWFCFLFFPNRSDHQYTCVYKPGVTFIQNHWQRVCCYISKNVSCYGGKKIHSHCSWN